MLKSRRYFLSSQRLSGRGEVEVKTQRPAVVQPSCWSSASTPHPASGAEAWLVAVGEQMLGFWRADVVRYVYPTQRASEAVVMHATVHVRLHRLVV